MFDDPDKTVRNVSYKELKARRKREEEIGNRIFVAIFYLTLLAIIVTSFAQAMDGVRLW